MKFSLYIPTGTTHELAAFDDPAAAFERIRELAVAAEEGGFEAIWAPDHFIPFGPGDHYVFEAWTTLAALARETNRTPSLAIVVGAVELAVHGWDVSVACGRDHPIPARLALGLLSLSQLIIDHSMRRSLFDGPVPVSPLASPSDQLVAFLGRGTVRQP
jgi:hypothetical protein